MSVALLAQAANCLGPLVDDVVFLGGASIGLWLSDPGAAEPRVTVDVDVVVVASAVEYYRLSERLRQRGFSEDSTSNVICRWRHSSGVVLDVMPTDASVLGFSNRWYPDAFETAVLVTLPDGQRIRAAAPVYIVATKIEAFRGRGANDYLASHDFEDIVRLLDGRPELIDEITVASSDVREFIGGSLGTMRGDTFFETGVAGALPPDAASQARLPIVLERIGRLAI